MTLVKCENKNCGKIFDRPNSLLNKHNYCCLKCYKEARNTNKYIIENDITKILITSKVFGEITVLIDTEDIEKCKNFIWSLRKDKVIKNFYIDAFDKENKTKISIHRLITNCPPDKIVDHINHNTLDNRKCNLQIVNTKLNMENRSNYNKNNKYSKIRGVHFDKRRNIYFSRIVHNGKNIYGGYFKTIEEAEKSVIELRKKYFMNVH